MTPFAGGMVQKIGPRNRPPNGPTARHNLAADNARWTRVRAPKSVPEFTANAFDDHHWRIRAVSLGRPKSLKSLGCSGGKASQTTNFMRNDKAKAHATVSVPRVIHGRARIQKSTRHYSNSTRKPSPEKRLIGLLLLRSALRTKYGSRYQQPPRITRSVPDSGPVGSVSGELS